jgi:NAD(P)-dependent dehydrogenase (short-subunit alcohol dehydrogenase family)
MGAVSRLAGKVCVVNGAASTIGQAIAERFAREGATVVGADKEAHSVGELAVRADLAEESQVASMYEQVVARYGRLDVIYNNMGLMDRGDRSALDTSLDTWRRVHDANLTSVFLCCKHGIKHLLATSPAGGSVINAASFLAELGAATAQMGYASAKAAVVQLTRDLGVHLARRGVRVNAVLFGPIDTPAQRAVFDTNPGALEKRLVHWPMGRFGTLDEAAGTVAFLASDDAGFITAAAVPLDGGITAAFTVPE